MSPVHLFSSNYAIRSTSYTRFLMVNPHCSPTPQPSVLHLPFPRRRHLFPSANPHQLLQRASLPHPSALPFSASHSYTSPLSSNLTSHMGHLLVRNSRLAPGTNGGRCRLCLLPASLINSRVPRESAALLRELLVPWRLRTGSSCAPTRCVRECSCSCLDLASRLTMARADALCFSLFMLGFQNLCLSASASTLIHQAAVRRRFRTYDRPPHTSGLLYATLDWRLVTSRSAVASWVLCNYAAIGA
ncbi:hypothetical protein BDW22DRAFT_618369 [Trametopsis cervina]|nr:hypothetical protein BDW22DRAFT_618369 [Trametopsis cervina]